MRGGDTVPVLHFVCTGLFKFNAFGVLINRICWLFGHPQYRTMLVIVQSQRRFGFPSFGGGRGWFSVETDKD
jgi:hypothetical protein